MAFNYSPKIITDGLVLYLDAANTRSYPGTGTVWTDLSRRGNNGTMINGPTFNNSNGGSFSFNGTTQYITVSNIDTILKNTQKFSYECWFKANITSGNYTLFSFGGEGFNFGNDVLVIIGSNTLGVQVDNGGDGTGFISFTSTNWNNIQSVYDGTLTGNSNRLKIYLNGIQQTLGFSSGYTVPTSTANGGTTSNIGRYTANNTLFFNGNISTTKLYNRPLSAEEILQNYNATKSRFGIL